MSAGNHLWMRLRRWWATQSLQAHHGQLEQAINELEAAVRADTDALASLRMERSRVSMRLRYVQTLNRLHRLQQQGPHCPQTAPDSPRIHHGQGHQP